MRFVTYVVLVLRRLWAKRWLLVGSFLGATLVTALLVIVPLYESSIAAVDLRFTVRGAPPVQVDISATNTVTDYEGAVASDVAEIVDAARDGISQWYPDAVEHTLSRELYVIPLGFPDWRARAASWRSDLEAWAAAAGPLVDMPYQDLVAAEALRRAVRDGDLDEVQAEALRDAGDSVPELDPPPYPQPPQEPTTTRMFTAPGLRDAVEVVAGDWPDAAAGELEVAIGEDLARLTGLAPGDEVVFRPFISLSENFEVVRVSAIVAPKEPGDVMWRSAVPASLAFVDKETFGLWTGPLTREASGDPWLRTLKGFPTLSASQFWYLALDRDSVTLQRLDDLSKSVEGFRGAVGRDNVVVTSGLPVLVGDFDVRKTVFGGPILAMLALVVAGALYFLVYTAGLTVEREGPELALLRTRGASGWQTAGIHITQSAFIAVAAAVVAPTVARLLVSATGRVPPMSDLTGGDALTVVGGRSLLPFMAAGTGLAFVSMGLAIVPFVRKSILELRALSARPGRLSIWQRYYVDIFLIILAGILLFELRQRGLVDVSTEPGLDPFSIASPALFLFAGALALLRLLPFLLRALGWLMTRMRGMTAALPGWHLGRNPIPYGRLALLIFLTTGFGAFALTYAKTLDDSYEDRAEFATGADARVVAEGVGLVAPPSGSTAASVYRSQGTARQVARSAELIAVETADFIDVVNWRSDFGGSPSQVFAPLLAADRAPLGVPLPPNASALYIGGVEVPESWAAQVLTEGIEPPLHAVARIRDGNRRLWIFPAEEPFTDTGWRKVRIPLDPAKARNSAQTVMQAPLTLQAVWVEREVSAGEPILVGNELLVGDITAGTPGGEVDLTAGVVATMEAAGGLTLSPAALDDAARAFYSQVPAGEERPDAAALAADPRVAPSAVIRWSVPSRNRAGTVPHLATQPEDMAVLLDATAARAAGLGVGESSTFGVDGVMIPGTVVGIIGDLPTASSRITNGKMVVDLDVLLQWLDGTPSWSLTGNIARVTQPGELWLRTADPDGAVLQVRSQLGVDDEDVEAFTIAGATSSFSSRPVQIGLVSILFVGAATGVLLALAGVTGYVLVAVRRRTREMGVLRALGLRRARVAATFAVEQLVVLVLGALIGVVGGVGLMRLMIPFLQLGEEAEELVPSVLLRIDLGVLGAYLAAVAVLMVVSVLWSTRTVSARDLSSVLRQGDR